MPPELPQPWSAPSPGQALNLEREARAEIGPDHELAGRTLTTIARCSGCDHVLFRLDDDTWAIVHLTWSNKAEQFRPERRELVVDTAADIVGIKPTKSNTERLVALDQDTVDMLVRHIERMDERASACGVEIAPNAYIFSLEPDCSEPMSADYLTKRVAVLKDHLGIPDKHPETVQLEDEALALSEPTRSRDPQVDAVQNPRAECPTKRSGAG